MRSGPTPGQAFPLTKNEISIGRDISNDVVISDSEISRKHARLILQSGGYVLEDLGSTNGTFVNGQRLMGPHLLRPGELIMLGENVSLTYEPGFDQDATMVSSPGPRPGTAEVFSQPPPRPYEPPRQYEPPQPVYTQEPVQQPRSVAPQPVSPPAYSGQIPQGPPEPYYEPEPPAEPRRNRTWIYASCGCLLVLACLLAAGAYAFDTLNLYCTPPFNLLFSCPP
jgi:hypothetical protein